MLRKSGVLGTGVIGSGIAQVLATFGFDVIARGVGNSVLKGKRKKSWKADTDSREGLVRVK